MLGFGYYLFIFLPLILTVFPGTLIAREPAVQHSKSNYVSLEKHVASMETTGWYLVDTYDRKAKPVAFDRLLDRPISFNKERGPFSYYHCWAVSTVIRPVEATADSKQNLGFDLTFHEDDSIDITIGLKSGKMICLSLYNNGLRSGDAQHLLVSIVKDDSVSRKTYLVEEQTVILDRFGTEVFRGFSGVITTKTFEKKTLPCKRKKRGKEVESKKNRKKKRSEKSAMLEWDDPGTRDGERRRQKRLH